MKTKSKLVLGLSILSAATLAAGATSTFAWYVATANANATGTSSQNELSSIAAATITTAYDLPVDLTWTVSGTPRQIDNSGNESVYINGTTQLQSIGAAADKFFTVTLSAVAYGSAATDQQKAAAKGKTFTGTFGVYTTANGNTASSRHAVHSTQVTSGYLVTETVSIVFSVDADGTIAIDNDHKTAYVCLAGGTIGENGAITAVNDGEAIEANAVKGYAGVLSFTGADTNS